jgi:hypothetical protein
MEFHYSQILHLLLAGFTVWMLVDAYRRGAEGYWYYVILFVPAIGPLVYFFAVLLPGWTGGRSWSLPFLSRRPSLDELRYRAEQTPTLANSLALAERLVEREEHAEAVPHLEKVLAQEPEHCQSLFLLAKCHADEGRPEKAIPCLEKVLARDRYWSNYAAWYLLIELRDEADDGAGALAACREVARLSPTLRHQCLLAEHLLDAGHPEEAEQVLDAALQEHQYAPGNIRWRNRRWAAEARRLLKRLPPG